MGAFITIPVNNLIASMAVGYDSYNALYGHCKVSYSITVREFSLIAKDTNDTDLLYTIIDNEELYHQIYPISIGAHLAIGGMIFSKNATPFEYTSYYLRDGSPESSTAEWYTRNIDNEMSNPINGNRYITAPVFARTTDPWNYIYEYTGIYGNITHINSLSELISAIDEYGISPYVASYPITYRLTNCTAPSAPTVASVGDTVNVPLQFTTGYGIVNPSTDVYVTNNGVVVPSQYSNGVLTFTMPDPS